MRGERDFEEPQFARRMTFLGAAAWSLGLGLVAGVLMELTESARPGAGLDLVNLTACRVVATSAFLFAILRIYSPEASVRDMLGIRPVSVSGSLLAGVCGGLLYPGLTLIDDAIFKRYPLAAEELERLDKLTNVSTRGGRAVLFVAFALLIPVCDEIFFRGVIFRALRRGRAEGMAVLASALLSAIAQGDPRLMPTGLVLGLLVAWVRGKSGSIVPAPRARGDGGGAAGAVRAGARGARRRGEGGRGVRGGGGGLRVGSGPDFCERWASGGGEVARRVRPGSGGVTLSAAPRAARSRSARRSQAPPPARARLRRPSARRALER